MSTDITNQVKARTTVTATVSDLAEIVAGLGSDEQALFLSWLAYRFLCLGEAGRGRQLAWIAEEFAKWDADRDRVVDFLLDLNGYIEAEAS